MTESKSEDFRSRDQSRFLLPAVLFYNNASSNLGDAMNPWKVSAQFAAFVWYSNRTMDQQVPAAEAARFARENWIAFLPYAQEGYGKLLIKIAKPRTAKSRRTRPVRSANPGRVVSSPAAVAP